MNLRVTFVQSTPSTTIAHILGNTRLETYHVAAEPAHVHRVSIPENDWSALVDALTQLMQAEQVHKITSRTHPVA